MSIQLETNDPVAVIGAGTMGFRILDAFARAGHAVTAVDIDAAARARAAEVAGVRSVDRLPAPGPRLTLLSLPDPAAVRDVVAGLAEVVPAGGTVLDLSTIDPQTARDCAELLHGYGVTYLDSPVLGRPAGVGTWSLVVGGDEGSLAPFEQALLATIAAKIVPLGQIGHGSVLKLMNNLMFGAINAITAEVLTVCAAAGLDPATFVDTVVASGAASVSRLFTDIGPRIVAGDFTPTFSLALLHKDNGLALELAARHHVPVIVGHSVQDLNTMALADYGSDDSAAVVRTLERITGLTVGNREIV
jgi:3-hydroxyisobutyrate dehydrogenase-like beta-hydroxyacid dehydrogenase